MSAIFPGLIQESRDILNLNCFVDGTWTTPKVHGTISIDHQQAICRSTGFNLAT